MCYISNVFTLNVCLSNDDLQSKTQLIFIISTNLLETKFVYIFYIIWLTNHRVQLPLLIAIKIIFSYTHTIIFIFLRLKPAVAY